LRRCIADAADVRKSAAAGAQFTTERRGGGMGIFEN